MEQRLTDEEIYQIDSEFATEQLGCHAHEDVLLKAQIAKLKSYYRDMTDEELREKVARIICCFAKDNNSCSECRENRPEHPFPNCFEDIKDDTNQIFSLVMANLVEKIEGIENPHQLREYSSREDFIRKQGFNEAIQAVLKAIKEGKG